MNGEIIEKIQSFFERTRNKQYISVFYGGYKENEKANKILSI
jgi:hypothetical protein